MAFKSSDLGKKIKINQSPGKTFKTGDPFTVIFSIYYNFCKRPQNRVRGVESGKCNKSSNIYAKLLNEGPFVIRAKEDISKDTMIQNPPSSKHAYIVSPQGPQKVSIFLAIISGNKLLPKSPIV